MKSIRIVSSAKYMPERIVTNNDLGKVMDTNDEWIVSRTGIKERRIATTETTSSMCAKVCIKLLEQANIKATEIDLIIVATMTPDYLTPSVACIVQGAISAKNALAFDINAACTGFVYGLSVADKMMKSGSYKNIIVVGSEVLSKVIDWSDRATAVLFGDGAGGVLLTSSNEDFILSEDLHSDGSRGMSLTALNIPNNNPYSKNEPSTKYLNMVGRDIFDFAIKSVPISINKVLEKSNLTLDDIKLIIPHQANYRIVEMFAKKLKTNMHKFYTNMDKYGNTSAASIPIALSELIENKTLKLGSKEKIIITGFGGGLTWGTMLLSI